MATGRKAFYRFDEDTSRSKLLLTPKLPIKIINPDTRKSINIYGVMDTGANNCTFPAYIAKRLGYTLNDRTLLPSGSKGIGGTVLPTHICASKIELLSQNGIVLREIDAPIHFLEHNDIPSLLGVNYFLEQFKITLDFLNNDICLEW